MFSRRINRRNRRFRLTTGWKGVALASVLAGSWLAGGALIRATTPAPPGLPEGGSNHAVVIVVPSAPSANTTSGEAGATIDAEPVHVAPPVAPAPTPTTTSNKDRRLAL
jgi:hypothetical protein